eukprot:365202-Chlamydomonas_euryale.AAC.1
MSNTTHTTHTKISPSGPLHERAHVAHTPAERTAPATQCAARMRRAAAPAPSDPRGPARGPAGR